MKYLRGASFLSLFLLLLNPDPLVASGRGPAVKPTVVSFRDLPKFRGGQNLPTRERPELEPPPIPAGRIPDARELKHFTNDAASAQAPAPQAPVITSGFEGITQGGYVPGEPSAAAGPLNIFSTGNISVTVTDKDGGNRAETWGKIFWGAPSTDDSISDPVCMYDALRGRFVALCFTTDLSYSHFFLAISATNDARGTWYRYMFDWTKDNTTATTNFGDFQEFGISDDKLVISSQQYHNSSYQYQKLRVFNRDSLYQGLAVSYLDFVNFPNQAFVVKPGRNLSHDSTIYLLATQYNGGSDVVTGTITGSSDNPVLSYGTSVAVQAYGSPVNAPGGSSPGTVEAGDCRTPNFIVRDGVLHIAWHFGVKIGSKTVDALRYLKMNMRTSPPTVLTDETFGAAATYMYYPNVMVDSAGSMFMGFGKSSSSEYPSSYVTGKRRIDASIQSSTVAKAGLAVTSQSRWGDYTGGDMDETASNDSGSVAWYAGQYTKAAAVFGAWITPLKFTYCKVQGQVLADADGDSTTHGDRSALAGWTVTMKKGAAVIATTTTDGTGAYTFHHVDPQNYTLELTVPTGYGALPPIPGTGGTSQSVVSNTTMADSVSGSQISTGNVFLVTQVWNSAASGNWNVGSMWLPHSAPPANRDVVIRSQDTVTVNGNDTCANLTLSGTIRSDGVAGRTLVLNGTPVLKSGSMLNLGTITLVLNGNPIADSSGQIVASSASSLTIAGSSAGMFVPSAVHQLNNLVLANPSGATLGGNLSVSGSLVLSSGVLVSGGDTISVASGGSASRTSGWLNGILARHYSAAGSRLFPLGTSNGYSPVTINAVSGTFPTTAPIVARVTQGVPASLPGTNVLQRYWTLGNGSIASANMTFQYPAADVVGTESAYSVSHKNTASGIWEIDGGTIDAGNHLATVTGGVLPASDWTAGEPSALPLQLSTFTGSARGSEDVELQWSTITELSILGFYVERRDPGAAVYTAISGLIPSAGTTLEEQHYSWTDTSARGGTYMYRLRCVDLDGAVAFSQNISVSGTLGVTGGVLPAAYALGQNYPNPFNPATVIRYDLPVQSLVILKVSNTIGQVVEELVRGVQDAGSRTTSFTTSGLPSGVYFYRIDATSTADPSRHFSQTKKMLLVR